MHALRTLLHSGEQSHEDRNWRIALLLLPAARERMLAGPNQLEGVRALGQVQNRRGIGGGVQGRCASGSILGGNVFKRTATVGQFMQQGEIDVMGVDQDGGIHAMDVAFHENGLNYGGGVANRVLKKLLRAYLLLSAYHPQETAFHIYFVSPKVHRAVQSALETTFSALQESYPEINWHLITNDAFHNQMVQPTLERTDTVADTAELFVRAAKLLNLSSATVAKPVAEPHTRPPTKIPISPPRASSISLQDLVRGVMRTLLEECPTLLDESELQQADRQSDIAAGSCR